MLSSWADGRLLVFRLVQRMTSFHTGGGCRQERTRKICCLPYGEEALQTGSGENAVLPARIQELEQMQEVCKQFRA